MRVGISYEALTVCLVCIPTQERGNEGGRNEGAQERANAGVELQSVGYSEIMLQNLTGATADFPAVVGP
jgi:hypothetical protein